MRPPCWLQPAPRSRPPRGRTRIRHRFSSPLPAGAQPPPSTVYPRLKARRGTRPSVVSTAGSPASRTRSLPIAPRRGGLREGGVSRNIPNMRASSKAPPQHARTRARTLAFSRASQHRQRAASVLAKECWRDEAVLWRGCGTAFLRASPVAGVGPGPCPMRFLRRSCEVCWRASERKVKIVS